MLPLDVVILAGGFGTRLQSVVSNIPKPMARINDIPFLEYIFKFLQKYKINKITMLVSYKWETIREYFGYQWNDIEIFYSIEKNPLGTGGAVANSLNLIKSNNFLLINGDSYFPINLLEYYNFHLKYNADISIAGKRMDSPKRYGVIELNKNRIIGFTEKLKKNTGIINCGMYIINRHYFMKRTLDGNFSFEKDLLQQHCIEDRYYCKIFDNYFIDIGIPSSFEKAQDEL